MPNLASIAQSGLQAAQVRLQAVAHNTANAQTPGFRRQTVLAQAVAAPVSGAGQGAGQGVAVSIAPSAEPGANPVQDAVDQLAARQAFLANLGVLKTAADTLGTLLSERA